MEKRDGKFVVADIAVDETYRGQGLGLRLMEIMDKEVQKRGGNEAWLAAKVPDFYRKLGWNSVAIEEAPKISDCLQCLQFGNECTPQIMVKILLKSYRKGLIMEFEKYRFTGDKKFDIHTFDTSDTGSFENKQETKAEIKKDKHLMESYQEKLYAEGKEGILIIFQSMDAAGKDGAIKQVFSGLNPQGVDVSNFKVPSAEESSHDYLWRVMEKLPPRGRIGIFNRSHYESVLVEKVHKLYLEQQLPNRGGGDIIGRRYKQIRDFESYLWENGITVIKFFLNISKEEQKKQLLQRIDDESKHWKFSHSDIVEREYWDAYQDAYEAAINATSTANCPWYVNTLGQEMVRALFGLKDRSGTFQRDRSAYSDIARRSGERVGKMARDINGAINIGDRKYDH